MEKNRRNQFSLISGNYLSLDIQACYYGVEEVGEEGKENQKGGKECLKGKVI